MLVELPDTVHLEREVALAFPVCSAPTVLRLLCELLLHPDFFFTTVAAIALVAFAFANIIITLHASAFLPLFLFPTKHLCYRATLPPLCLLLLPRIYTRPLGGLRAPTRRPHRTLRISATMPSRNRIKIRKAANDVQRKIKVVTEQHVIDKPSPMEAFPMREWSLKIFLLDEDGNERPADVFNKVVYNLHPTFENPVQTFTKAPFTCSNEGWGEFEISIDCYTTEKTKLAPIIQDLNFQKNKYDVTHTVVFKNPSQNLQERLRETGPLPTDDDHRPKKKGLATKKSAQKYDYEKIAEALEKLEEEDLLRVIQLINENKGPDTYIRSDVEAGEFSIDLYTMPDILTTKLWDHLSKKGLVS
ncbi:hypothetical protein CDV31_000559 [Fusarium ambrosium]|uniref:YEATS domain-containing protein n=1 Tax=Fusarium ambrosium TaxID=131363 RepID=A0A428V238_9HYPO|nr:hypothetical protein CDV31_000559 [Fusarium ambrosium]